MRRVLVPGVLALALLIGACASTVQADFVFRGRRIVVRVNVPAGPPPVVIQRQPAVPVEPPPGVPLEIAPPAAPVPLPSTGVVPAGRPPTLQEFACSFRPTCGTHRVVLLHPITNCPVSVCFTLPAGCPRVKIKRCLRHRLEFDYGRHEVEIVFYRNGRVKVDY